MNTSTPDSKPTSGLLMGLIGVATVVIIAIIINVTHVLDKVLIYDASKSSGMLRNGTGFNLDSKYPNMISKHPDAPAGALQNAGWDINVPETGTYHLSVECIFDQPCPSDLLIDNVTVSSGKLFNQPTTGALQWKEQGTVELQEGQNISLRFQNTGGCTFPNIKTIKLLKHNNIDIIALIRELLFPSKKLN